MDNNFNNNNYNDLIKKINRRRLIAAVIYFVSIVISMNICIPSFISVGDRIIFENKGANPIITILVFLLLSFVFLIAVGVILSPVLRAMNEESDPQKYIALAAPFYKNHMDQVYSVAYFYMGNFLGSRFYSEKLSQSKKAKIKLNALFTKASCEFFLNDIETFKNTAMQFKYTLAQEKLKQKDREHFQSREMFLDLMAAFSENNIEQIKLCQNLPTDLKSKASQGFANYLGGIAAYILGDREKAIYYFVAVKTECPKTFFPPLCDQYLEKLK